MVLNSKVVSHFDVALPNIEFVLINSLLILISDIEIKLFYF